MYDCFNSYTAVENLDCEIEVNEETGEREKAKRQILFGVSNVLVILLKRFGNNMRKNKDRIDFPLENLNLQKICCGL